jgi:hypothetical protein
MKQNFNAAFAEMMRAACRRAGWKGAIEVQILRPRHHEKTIKNRRDRNADRGRVARNADGG